MINLNETFMNALSIWVNEGRRAVDINIDNISDTGSKIKIWCYDYDLQAGAFATSTDTIPTTRFLEDKSR